MQEFKGMVKHNKVHIPQGLAKDWSEETISAMAEVAYNLPHMWDHAFGPGLAEGAGPGADQGVVSEDVSCLHQTRSRFT